MKTSIAPSDPSSFITAQIKSNSFDSTPSTSSKFNHHLSGETSSTPILTSPSISLKNSSSALSNNFQPLHMVDQSPFSNGTYVASVPPTDVPKCFLCPISLETMEDPVVIQCGHTFEKKALLKWLQGEVILPDQEAYSPAPSQNYCPVCKAAIDDSIMIPCFTIKSAIHDWRVARKEQENLLLNKTVNPKLNFTSSTLNGRMDQSSYSSSVENKTAKSKKRPVISLLGLKWRLGSNKKKEKISTSTQILAQTSTDSLISTPAPTPTPTSTPVPTSTPISPSPSISTPNPIYTTSSSTVPVVHTSNPIASFPTSTVVHESTFASSLSSTFARVNDPPFVPDEKTDLAVPVWAALVPHLPIHPPIQIDRDSFYVGRHSACHARIYLSEVSSKHFNIFREKRSDGLYQVYIEDCSTNGTFVNGQSLGKGHIKPLYPGDEISIGRKFNSRKELPEVSKFIDFVFADGPKQKQGHTNDPHFFSSVQQLKEIPSFVQLLSLIDQQLCSSSSPSHSQLDIHSTSVRCTLMSALHSWKHEHRFPAYVFEVKSTCTQSYVSPSMISGSASLDDAMASLRLDPSLVPALQRWFPTLSKEVLSLILHYEQKQSPSLPTDQILRICSEKIKDFYGLSVGVSQDPSKLAARAPAPFLPPSSHPLAFATNATHTPSSFMTSSLTPNASLSSPSAAMHYVLQADSNGHPWLIPVVLPSPVLPSTSSTSSTSYTSKSAPSLEEVVDKNAKRGMMEADEKQTFPAPSISSLFPASISSLESPNLHATAKAAEMDL